MEYLFKKILNLRHIKKLKKELSKHSTTIVIGDKTYHLTLDFVKEINSRFN